MSTSRQRVSGRRDREQELVKATRALFDERGMQEAPVEEIAKAVGIARGLIYRQFASKDELYVLTVTDYLTELDALLADACATTKDPAGQLVAWSEAYADFCFRYPAFLDCVLSLMRRPARDLHDALSESVWLRLGQSMSACVAHVADVLRDGRADGSFTAIDDCDLTANVLWTQMLGAAQLARIRVGIGRNESGLPQLFTVAPEKVVEMCVSSALATVGAAPR